MRPASRLLSDDQRINVEESAFPEWKLQLDRTLSDSSKISDWLRYWLRAPLPQTLRR
jgi:hypothetical protein